MKNIIHIFGASGSGTTTLGKQMCNELGYKLIDVDDYFWMPTDPCFTEKRPVEERIALIKNDIDKYDNVVISGSLVDWGDVFIPYFTLAIRLETEAKIRVSRLRQREKARFGSRIDQGGDMYEQHINFIEWAKSYDNGEMDIRSKRKHDEWQKQLNCKLIELNGADSLEHNISKIISEIKL